MDVEGVGGWEIGEVVKTVEGDRGREDGGGRGEVTGAGGEGEEIDPWDMELVEKGMEGEGPDTLVL